MQLRSKTFWLAANQSDGDDLLDFFTNNAMRWPRGSALSFPVAFFNGDPAKGDNLIDDLGNVVSATLTVRKESAAGTLLFEQTIAVADFTNAALTYEQWSGRTSAHVTFTRTPSEANWSLSDWYGKVYFAIGVDTTDGSYFLVQAGRATFFEDGTPAVGDEPTEPQDPAPISEEQADARSARIRCQGADTRLLTPTVATTATLAAVTKKHTQIKLDLTSAAPGDYDYNVETEDAEEGDEIVWIVLLPLADGATASINGDDFASSAEGAQARTVNVITRLISGAWVNVMHRIF